MDRPIHPPTWSTQNLRRLCSCPLLLRYLLEEHRCRLKRLGPGRGSWPTLGSDRSKPRNPKSRIRIPFSEKSHSGVFRFAEFDVKKTIQFFHVIVIRRDALGRGASHHTQPGFGA
ncbi:hypothetical protein TB1_027700 [Malus domestica]